MDKKTSEFIQGPRLARNTIINFLGLLVPVVTAVVTIPPLIGYLGSDRFGLLALAWMVIGYFSLFDLGLGRALTKLVAEKLGEGRSDEVKPLVWTAILMMFLLGCGGILIVIFWLPWFVRDVINIPELLLPEALRAFYVLLFSVPIVIISIGLRGVLEAYQRFDLTNMVRIPLGVFTFIGPLAAAPFSQNIFHIVVVLLFGRILSCLVYFYLCSRIVPGLFQGVVFRSKMMLPLIRFGGWMTVSNVISPLMVYLDRFYISAIISITAVAYYVTPFEVVTKLWLIAGAVVSVLFPAFSASFIQDRDHLTQLYTRGVKYIAILLFPVVLIIITFSGEGLRLWLGSEFADNGTAVMQWLTAGVFFNSLAAVPFALIQGAGRPDLTAKLHIIELPFYLVGLWWLVTSMGIEGAAVAWTARVLFDMTALFWIAHHLLGVAFKEMTRNILILAFALPAMVLGAGLSSLPLKSLFVFSVCITFMLITWFVFLSKYERSFFVSRVKIFKSQ